MSLSEQSTEATIREILAHYSDHPPEMLGALEELNNRLGYLPCAAIESTARHFHVPQFQTYGLATFYSMWHAVTMPVEEAVELCDDGPCHAAGAGAVRRALEEAGVTVRRTSCLGQCAGGPVVRIGERFYRQLTPDTIEAVLAGEEPPPVAVADEILDIAVDDASHALLRNAGRTDPSSLEEAVAAGAYEALCKAVSTMTQQQVLDEIAASGLQGRGGAGFPTATKMRLTMEGARSGDGTIYMLCDADESEPGTFKDRMLIESDPHRLLEGMAIAAYTIGAHEGYIYIRGKYFRAAALLAQAIRDAEAAGYLGPDVMGCGYPLRISMHQGAGAYICGEETALIESLEGKRGEPRVRPPFPTTHGLFGKATLNNNVETLCNLPDIVAHGAAWYRQAGTEKSPGTKLYPISGHVKRRGCLEMPLGQMSLRQVIAGPAGGMRGDAPFKACHVAGAAGAIVGSEFLDVPLDFEAYRAAGAALSTGDLMILDADACIVDYVRAVARFFRAESCGKCTPCRVGTERYLQLLNELASGRGTPGHLDELVRWGKVMSDSSFCGLGQTASTAAMSALKLFRDEFEAHARGECPVGVCPERGRRGAER
jgi:NADH:ubiquinone oxidoreductase subunit F (NADH-binding)/NADH:ubiquinone oxidoreductase subunit E